MKTSQIAELAAALAAGAITEDAISDRFGDSVLSSVLSFGTGAVVGITIPSVMRETGVSDLIDGVFGDIF